MPARCTPPKSVQVKGHWRNIEPGRKKKRKQRKPTGRPYWNVTNGLGGSCGHHHRTLSGAVACRRRHDRAQRATKARYGRSAAPGRWSVERHNG